MGWFAFIKLSVFFEGTDAQWIIVRRIIVSMLFEGRRVRKDIVNIKKLSLIFGPSAPKMSGTIIGVLRMRGELPPVAVAGRYSTVFGRN